MMDKVSFPWRLSALGSYKRDTGSSPESHALYGKPDIVFVFPPVRDGPPGWTASLMADDGSSDLLGPFETPAEAREAADRTWPWWTGEQPPPLPSWLTDG